VAYVERKGDANRIYVVEPEAVCLEDLSVDGG
jgi:hypothetical protein